MAWNITDWFNIFKPQSPSLTKEVDKNSKLPHVVWLHGANQSSNSFNYLRDYLPDWDCTLVNYSSQNGFYENLEKIVSDLDTSIPSFVIGHSMGGLYALHLTKYINVVGAVTMSTPFRGSSMADWAKYIVPSYHLFRDVGRRSKPIQEAHEIEINIPWTQIISTTGSVPYFNGPNDGVCTIASMEHRSEDMKIIHVEHTHYEIVCSTDVADIINQEYDAVSANFLNK